jgi:hypothetical protein
MTWRRSQSDVSRFSKEISFLLWLAHPLRGGKPEFKLERYPPLDVPACSIQFFSSS